MSLGGTTRPATARIGGGAIADSNRSLNVRAMKRTNDASWPASFTSPSRISRRASTNSECVEMVPVRLVVDELNSGNMGRAVARGRESIA